MSQFPTTQPVRGSFPIRKATGTPPAVGPSVPARLDTRTGAAEQAAALTRTGAGLAQFGMDALTKIQAAADAVELSSVKRQYDEIMNAAVLAASQAPDEEAANLIREKAQEDVQELMKGIKRQTVLSGAQMHHDRTKPRWEAAISLGIMKRQIDNIKSDAEVNMAKDLALNTPESLERVKDTLNMLYDKGLINDTQRDVGIENRGFNGILAQATVLAATDPKAAVALAKTALVKTPQQGKEKTRALVYLKQKLSKSDDELEVRQQEELAAFHKRLYTDNEAFSHADVVEALPSWLPEDVGVIWRRVEARQEARTVTGDATKVVTREITRLKDLVRTTDRELSKRREIVADIKKQMQKEIDDGEGVTSDRYKELQRELLEAYAEAEKPFKEIWGRFSGEREGRGGLEAEIAEKHLELQRLNDRKKILDGAAVPRVQKMPEGTEKEKQAWWDALAPGTYFVDDTGKTMRKP